MSVQAFFGARWGCLRFGASLSSSPLFFTCSLRHFFFCACPSVPLTYTTSTELVGDRPTLRIEIGAHAERRGGLVFASLYLTLSFSCEVPPNGINRTVAPRPLLRWPYHAAAIVATPQRRPFCFRVTSFGFFHVHTSRGLRTLATLSVAQAHAHRQLYIYMHISSAGGGVRSLSVCDCVPMGVDRRGGREERRAVPPLFSSVSVLFPTGECPLL